MIAGRAECRAALPLRLGGGRGEGAAKVALLALLLCAPLTARAQDAGVAVTPTERQPPIEETDEVAPDPETPADTPSDAPTGDAPTDDAPADAASPDAAPSEADQDLEVEASEEPLEDPVDATDEPAEAPVEEAAPPDEAPLPAPRDDGTLDPCATDLRGRPIGPLQVGALDGNLGVPHRACPRQELALGGDLLLVAHTADFYGDIRANGRVRISAPILSDKVEGFLSWEAFRYQTVISSVAAAYTGLGYLAWGASGQVWNEGGGVVALTGRMVLPTTSGLDQSSQPLALDLGVTAAYRIDPAVRFHAWLTLVGSIGLGGPADPRGGVRIGAGADLRAAEWISFVLELGSGFGYQEALDFLAAQGGVRLAFSTDVGLELAVAFPFLGARAFDDGALPITASLMLAWHMQ